MRSTSTLLVLLGAIAMRNQLPETGVVRLPQILFKHDRPPSPVKYYSEHGLKLPNAPWKSPLCTAKPKRLPLWRSAERSHGHE